MNNKPLIINGKSLSPKKLLEKGRQVITDPSQPEWLQDFYEFILDWMDDRYSIEVETSGTTGSPKSFSISKDQMIQSAAKTLAYFNLNPGDNALLCLSAKYIAGKMMIVRAITGELNLIIQEPSSDPWETLESKIDFIPVVPLQVQKLIQQPEKQKFVKRILVGGAPIDHQLEKKLQKIASAVFQSYGMTETLTHVALRRVNGENSQEFYTALEGVTFSVDERKRLVVDVDFLDGKVRTNDVVTLLDEKRFVWQGRMDSVINSGGVKVSPEEVEKKLSKLIYRRFFVAGIPDDNLGEKIILIIEGSPMEKRCLEALKNRISWITQKYEVPKVIYFTKKFPETGTGKIKRQEVINNLLY